jgi:hypothetical protein
MLVRKEPVSIGASAFFQKTTWGNFESAAEAGMAVASVIEL